MQEAAYKKMTQPFREHPKLAKSLHITNQILTGAVFFAYPCLLFYLLWRREATLYLSIVVPLDGFLLVSAFRYFVNRKGPYERFAIAPVIPKETKGKSFPSRHVFSAAVIAVTYLVQPQPFLVGIGIALLAVSFLLGAIRVVSGVHYISDVLAALAFAGIGWVSYCILL